MQASISKIESMGLSDGPGIRTVIFFNGCNLRCQFCHNPETWLKKEMNISLEELINKIKRYKNYYGNTGGITLSGGEPLLQINFLIKLCQELKKENIHIALDTSGVGLGEYKELLKYIDLVLLDIKHIDELEYFKLTKNYIHHTKKFIKQLNERNTKVWIRQVIIPNYNDNITYLNNLLLFLNNIKNIEKIELIPYHNMALSKYKELNINYPFKHIPSMDKQICLDLEKYLNKKLKKNKVN